MTDTLWHWFRRQVRERPAAPAVGAAGRDGVVHYLTWRDLDDRVDAAISSRGSSGPNGASDQDGSCDQDGSITPVANCVTYVCDNTIDDVVRMLACWRMGWVDVPIDASLPQPMQLQIRRRIADAGSLPADAAVVLWTSGTTDSPKGVLLSRRGQTVNAHAKLAAVPQTPDDRRLTVLPIAHAYARTCDLGTWLISGCVLVLARGIAGWQAVAAQTRPTLANVVPALATRLLRDDIDPRGTEHLRLLGCGGAGLDAATDAAWRRRGVTVIAGYGLTETGPVLCSATPSDSRHGYVGKPVAGWQTRLVDGRLWVRGDALMLGYVGDRAATADRVDPQGWLDTGDLVDVDVATGQFRILGRSDDVIVMPSGHKLHPAVLERRLAAATGQDRVLVRRSGRDLQVWLDTDQPLTRLRGLIADAAADLPPWQRPTSVHRFEPPLQSDEVTTKGTIRRNQILCRWSTGDQADAGSESSTRPSDPIVAADSGGFPPAGSAQTR